MERATEKAVIDKRDFRVMNEALAKKVLREIAAIGIEEIVICPAGRNAPFVQLLDGSNAFKISYWPEERSAAFFALGCSRRSKKPVAVIVTSGTAAAELLAAAVEAYYTGDPLILITADRPRRYRNSGAPQTIEQQGLFGVYTSLALDIEGEEEVSLHKWNKKTPLHINVCFEEPKKSDVSPLLRRDIVSDKIERRIKKDPKLYEDNKQQIKQFFQKANNPLVIVSDLLDSEKESVRHFLTQLKVPVVLEASSGLRGDKALSDFEIHRADLLWEVSRCARYSIDSILRIGGVPTLRGWRDLEEKYHSIHVLSVSRNPFSGLSRNSLVLEVDNLCFLDQMRLPGYIHFNSHGYIELDHYYGQEFDIALDEEPFSEPAWMRRLSLEIPEDALVYLGNSLPIRNWEMAANRLFKYQHVHASRGANGIDGQISTFLGLADKKRSNWGIFGDLTMLYDMAGPWILKQMKDYNINIVVINNGGGKIFDRMFGKKSFLNEHQLNFFHLASFWQMNYVRWDSTAIPDRLDAQHSFIEIIPDELSTGRFWKIVGYQNKALSQYQHT